MLTKKTPEVIRATLNIKTMGVENTLALTFFNRSQEDLIAFVDKQKAIEIPKKFSDKPVEFINASVTLYLVKSFDDGTDSEFPLNLDGLLELESIYPGILTGIIRGFHQSRITTVEKN